MENNIRRAHLHARITPADHELLKRAARIEGSTVKDFVLAVATAAAKERIETTKVIDMLQSTGESVRIFADMLQSELQVIPAMARPRQDPQRTAECPTKAPR